MATVGQQRDIIAMYCALLPGINELHVTIIWRGSLERGKASAVVLEVAEAAEKLYLKGPEGPEKRKSRKPEGKGPVILHRRY